MAFAVFLGGALLGWSLHGSSGQARRGSAPHSLPGSEAADTPEARAAAALAARDAYERAAKPLSPGVREMHAATGYPTMFSRIAHAILATSQLRLEEIPEALAFSGQNDEGEVFKMGVLIRWAQLDPRGAVKWLEKQPPGFDHDAISEMIGGEWAAADPAAARRWVDSLATDGQPRAWRGYLGARAFTDPEAGLKELERFPPEERMELQVAFFEAWAGYAPHAAIQAADDLADPQRRQAARQAVLALWGKSQPREAVTAAVQEAGPGDQPTTNLIRQIIKGWASREPGAALTQLAALPAYLQNDVSAQVFATAFETSPELALAAIDKMPSGPAADAARARSAVYLVKTDPAQAVEVLSGLPEGAVRRDALRGLCAAWAESDPAAAAEWTLKLPEGDEREAASIAILEREKDPAAMAAWLQGYPAGANYDAAVAVYSRSLAQKDPAAAAEWAGSIGDATKRETQTREVVEAWLTQNPDRAKAWLRTTHAIGADLRSWLLRSR